jgi:hypothetical protein
MNLNDDVAYSCLGSGHSTCLILAVPAACSVTTIALPSTSLCVACRHHSIDPAGVTGGKSLSGSNTLLKKFVREPIWTAPAGRVHL